MISDKDTRDNLFSTKGNTAVVVGFDSLCDHKSNTFLEKFQIWPGVKEYVEEKWFEEDTCHIFVPSRKGQPPLIVLSYNVIEAVQAPEKYYSDLADSVGRIKENIFHLYKVDVKSFPAAHSQKIVDGVTGVFITSPKKCIICL